MTATSVAAEAPSAASRSHGLGADSRITLLQLHAQIAQWPGAADVRHRLGEVLRRRRGGGEPLERIGDPGIVADPLAAAPRPEHVDHEEEYAGRHHPGTDRRDQVVRLPDPSLVV